MKITLQFPYRNFSDWLILAATLIFLIGAFFWRNGEERRMQLENAVYQQSNILAMMKKTAAGIKAINNHDNNISIQTESLHSIINNLGKKSGVAGNIRQLKQSRVGEREYARLILEHTPFDKVIYFLSHVSQQSIMIDTLSIQREQMPTSVSVYITLSK